MKIKSTLVTAATVIALTALTTGCQHSPSSHSTQTDYSPACSSNPYLMKYGCSIKRIQQAAENGSADAQYALGYMYYYGINTVKDRQTAELWIQRAAAQGQPLAKKAWSLINTGASFTDLHKAASEPSPAPRGVGDTIVQQDETDINKMNSTTPSEPISKYLPAYRQNPSTSANSTPNTASAAETTANPTNTTTTNNSVSDTSNSVSTVPPLSDNKEKSSTNTRLSENSVTPVSNKPLAENKVKTVSATLSPEHKVKTINDPRLASNAVPRTATPTISKPALAENKMKASSDAPLSENNVKKASNTRSTENKPKTMNDPRLSENAEPVVASALKNTADQADSIPHAMPASKTISTSSGSDKNAYTIQLLGSAKLSDVTGFMSAHSLGDKANYYRTEMNGKPWYMLTYGKYATEQQAEMALQKMPANLQKHHPWIKTFAAVQKEVNAQKVTA